MERSVSRRISGATKSEKPLDLWLLGAIVCLLVIGVVEVFASSAVYALKTHNDSLYFLKRQLVSIVLGSGALVAGMVYDYRWLRRWAYPLLIFSMVLLAGTLFIGGTVNGASRWYRIGPLSFQPVELAKLSLVCYLAYSFSRKADKLSTFSIGFVPHFLVCVAMVGLLLKQPDLGSSIILVSTTLTMLFVAGTKKRYIALAVLCSAPLAYSMIVLAPWRLNRFLAYFNPTAFQRGVGYQIVQAQLGMGSGGVFGTGLGNGRQQLLYLPAGHSDFIISGIGEELGFVGVFFTLLLFGIVVWRSVRAAIHANDSFGSYLALGITLGLGYQVLIHTGVALGILPAKGITLPFVSYGGSSMVMSMYFGGLLLGIGRRKRSYSSQTRSSPLPIAGGVMRRKRAILVVE